MLGWLERNQLLLLACAVLALAAAFAYSLVDDAGDPPALELRYGSDLPLGAPIRVHVAGAVANPGVYDLEAGDRVTDALAAAGGPAANADAAILNLARYLRDGEQIVVPALATTDMAAAITTSPGAKVDINTASAELLDALPGIGEAYSRRIVDSRTLDGPYDSIEDLIERNVLPRATFDRISSLISVGGE